MNVFLRNPTTVVLAAAFSLPSQLIAQTGDAERVHDPCIVEAHGLFHLFSTGMAYHAPTGPSIQLRTSADLFRWKKSEPVFKQLPNWTSREVPGVRDLWAPDISFFNGRYHLYYSVSTFGSGRACIGLATTETLDATSDQYRWNDHGKVVESVPGRDDWCAIDPNVVIDRDGQPWLSFGSFRGGIKLVKLNPETGRPTSELISIAARPDGASAIEAPFIIRRGSMYYLFVSFDFCCKGVNSDYKIFVGRSRRVEGPYEDRVGASMMHGGGTLVLKGHKDIIGPGHCAVFADDSRHWLAHHYYDARRNGLPTLQIRPIVWTKDGWPLAGEPLINKPRRRKLTQADIVGTWEHSVDFKTTGRIHLQAGGSIGGGNASWKYSRRHEFVLRWPRREAPDGAWIDRCQFTPDGRCYVGMNQGGGIIRGVRIDHGLGR